MYKTGIMVTAVLAAGLGGCGSSTGGPSGGEGGAADGGQRGDARTGADAGRAADTGVRADVTSLDARGTVDGSARDSAVQEGGRAIEAGTTDGSPHTTDTGGAPGLHPTMIILMENHGYSDIIGDTTDAPYINSLATGYASATAWSDVTHPSLPNYLALTSGSFYSTPQDCIPTWATPTGDCTFDTPASSLADQLTAAGISWKAYMEDMPTPCDTTDTFSPGSYDVNHDPIVYYDHVVQTPSECKNVVPFGQLATDLAAGALPTFIWVTPNIIHDMHDGTIADGDGFLHGLIPQIQSSAWYQQGGSIILTWDEGETTDQIVAIVVSIANTGRGAFATPGNHFGTLRGIEEVYGFPLLGSASDPTSGDLKPLLQ